jgi:hypothetical protein
MVNELMAIVDAPPSVALRVIDGDLGHASTSRSGMVSLEEGGKFGRG